ncbi:hypothetical protein Moror_5481 [Moniliophthora roreri MCA 2997]|uniref:Uncharacterized protein n=1 Tax=Moniliophthora roreri (strain MCA 2997) TaxID=1381753 RepID=V2X640_MONRO|nr:hypothetical protein Moror_5481 [Moniliophthora roreri MCA 2997]
MTDAAPTPTGIDTAAAGTLGPLQFEGQRRPTVDSFTIIDTDNNTLKAVISIAQEVRTIVQDTMQGSHACCTLSCPFFSLQDALRGLSDDTFDTACTVVKGCKKILERGQGLPPGLEHRLRILKSHMEDILRFVKRQQSGSVGFGWITASRDIEAYRKELRRLFYEIDNRIALHRHEEDHHKGQPWPGSAPTDSAPSSPPISAPPSPSTATQHLHAPNFTIVSPQEFPAHPSPSGDNSGPSTETAGTNITYQYYNTVYGDQYNNNNHNANHVNRGFMLQLDNLPPPGTQPSPFWYAKDNFATLRRTGIYTQSA